MRRVPHGKLTTIDDLRAALAAKYKVDVACPITTGIFGMRPYLRFLMTLLFATARLSQGEQKADDSDFIFKYIAPIADADPAVREEREVLAPAGFQAARTADEMVVCERAGPLKSIKLMVGHKMEFGMTTKLFIYPEGTERPAEPQWQEWNIPGFPWGFYIAKRN